MLTPETTPSRLLVIGTHSQEIESLLGFARTLAQARELEIVVVGLVVTSADAVSAGARAAQALRQHFTTRLPTDLSFQVRVTADAAQEIKHLVKQERGELALANTASALASILLDTIPCDVVLAKGALPKQVKRILLPIRGGPYAALALETALTFAKACDAEITLLHATPSARFRDQTVRALFQQLHALPEITRWLRAKDAAAHAILAQAKPRTHQLLVMGASPRARHPKSGAAVTPDVLEQSRVPTLVVRTAPALLPPAPLQGELAPVDYTISVIVDKWFAENTFSAHEFEDIAQLVRLKQQQGLTISLGLPTLNEEATIGNVIKTMRRRFVVDYPLLDEIVVIDSASTDRTVEIATELGVPVVKHPEVLTQYGVWAGKGEALWNSLYILQGDLIAWIDTDIVNIHPRFVYGILGPLIREPRLMYVKGFYQRPLRLGRKLQARGGGRVTELTARPLLNLFYPELSGFVQPLAGEYAGRREALEQVPFFVGYGVETGLLIDLLTRFGLQALGQVDLEERVHRNQSLHALSKMAFEIVQVVMQRVGEARGVELVEQINRSMKLIRYENDDFDLQVADIQIRERPPMITIPEYRKLRMKDEG
jgi:glucosyl-3-phosphoglycerate synthase